MERKIVGHRGFLFKHLNGEYSLPRAFWVNTILLAWILPLIALVAQSMNLGRPSPRVASAEYLVITGLQCILLTWGAVGTARSGKRYLESGGSKLWRNAALWVAIFLVVDMAWYISRAALVENVRMVFTGRYAPPASISTINNGTGLLVKGSLQNKTATELLKALDTSTSVTSVILDSKGGMFQQARIMAQAIRDHRLNTYVERECSSACTVVFLAGKSRCISSIAKVGFHSGMRLGTSPDAMPRGFAEAQRDLYAKAGLPPWFIENIMATPRTSIWFPSYSELLNAGVVTPDCPQVN
jgi:hypothetical protein